MSRDEARTAHDEWLIGRWNERIQPRDLVYHLGDFAFRSKAQRAAIIQRLNGTIHLVRGNHDPDPDTWWKEQGFEWVRDYYVLKVHDQHIDEEDRINQYHQSIVLMHFPILSWENMHHGTWHLHGHSHGSLPMARGMRYDVGVDPNNWYPISYEEVKKIMIMRTVVPVDHHGS